MGTRSDRRSTSSKDSQGSSEDRRRRKRWLVQAWRADVDVLIVRLPPTHFRGERLERVEPRDRAHMDYLLQQWADLDVERVPACRCFHCGCLLTAEDVSPDRIVPGCEGGTYKRSNIRPVCLPHNIELGSRLGHERRRARAGAKVPRPAG